MKPLPSPAPRVTCQVIRFWSSLRRDTTAPLAHLETCESCRQFFVSTHQLQTALREEARRTPSRPSGGLEGRVMEAIRRSNLPPRRSYRSTLQWSLSGAAAVGLLTLLSLGRFTFFPGGKNGTEADLSPTVTALVEALRTLPSDLKHTVEGPTEQLTQNNPLHREMENVYSDARSALDFLALNFLPNPQPDDRAESPQRG